MFTKLLKQEWRATRGILGLLCLVSLIAAVLGGGSMRFLVGMSQETEEMEGIIVLCAMILACAIIAIAVCCAASVFLMIWRFYRSRCPSAPAASRRRGCTATGYGCSRGGPPAPWKR